MNEPPDQTAEFSAANLLSFCGMIVPEVLLDELLVLAQPGVHVEEEDALGLEILLELVVDDLGLVLGTDAGQVVLLSLGDAEPVPCVLDVRRQIFPGLRLLLGRPDVIEDAVEVDLADVAAPFRKRAREEVVERLEAELPHPVRLVLVLGDRCDELVGEPTARLEEVVLGIVKPVLVLGLDAADDFGLGESH